MKIFRSPFCLGQLFICLNAIFVHLTTSIGAYRSIFRATFFWNLTVFWNTIVNLLFSDPLHLRRLLTYTLVNIWRDIDFACAQPAIKIQSREINYPKVSKRVSSDVYNTIILLMLANCLIFDSKSLTFFL